jgi:hypothetical protein
MNAVAKVSRKIPIPRLRLTVEREEAIDILLSGLNESNEVALYSKPLVVTRAGHNAPFSGISAIR